MNRKQIITLVQLGVGAAVVGAVILDQLRRPAERRTWQGQLLGVPYDFRMPTPERIHEKIWNKHTSRVLMPHLFGVGWSLNLYPLLHPTVRNLDRDHAPARNEDHLRTGH